MLLEYDHGNIRSAHRTPCINYADVCECTQMFLCIWYTYSFYEDEYTVMLLCNLCIYVLVYYEYTLNCHDMVCMYLFSYYECIYLVNTSYELLYYQIRARLQYFLQFSLQPSLTIRMRCDSSSNL